MQSLSSSLEAVGIIKEALAPKLPNVEPQPFEDKATIGEIYRSFSVVIDPKLVFEIEQDLLKLNSTDCVKYEKGKAYQDMYMLIFSAKITGE